MTIFHSAGRDSGGRYSHAYQAIAGLGLSIARRWRERRTLRILEALPADMMKDVGYPAAFHTGDGDCRKKG